MAKNQQTNSEPGQYILRLKAAMERLENASEGLIADINLAKEMKVDDVKTLKKQVKELQKENSDYQKKITELEEQVTESNRQFNLAIDEIEHLIEKLKNKK